MDTFKKKPFALFSVLGIEIEYMIVDKQILNIVPITDRILERIAGTISNEVIRGDIALNNELALHVIELKTNGPVDNLAKAHLDFHREVIHVNNILSDYDAQLMPTGMHPWLDPSKDIQLWPHGDKKIYETYDRIFDCKGHGWSNLQSIHINMPFANEEDFVKLHNAIRLVLPITPALFASTPIYEAQSSNYVSTRLMVYANNQKKIPSIIGDIIPEYIKSYDDYYQTILNPMYEAIAPFDPEKILQDEWLNSRGAIARFNRNAIEIRVVDSQECPLADLSCATAIAGVIQHIVNQTDMYLERPLDNSTLKKILFHTIRDGFSTEIQDKSWIEQLGLPQKQYSSARHIWYALLEQSSRYIPAVYQPVLEHILSHGNLSERIQKSLSKNFTKLELFKLYSHLCECLNQNKLLML